MSDLAYKKYGFTVNDNSEAMQLGINAQKANLTEVIGGIKNLMTNQEAQYKQENTLNVQNYFKDKLQAGGLNAAMTQPINQEGIKAKFGNMIDLPAVTKIAEDQTNLMLDKATTDAAQLAYKSFDDTKDESVAMNTYQNRLIELGVPVDKAGIAAIKWSADNAALPKMHEVFKSNLLDTAQTEFTNIMRDTPIDQMSFKEAVNFVTAGQNDRYKTAITDRLKTTYDAMGKLDENQKADLITAHGLIDNAVKADELRIMQPVDAAKTALDAVADPIDPGVAALTKSYGTKNLGGIIQAMSDDASNGIFKGSVRGLAELFNWKLMSGGEVGQEAEKNIDAIMKTHPAIDRGTAVTIALQAFQQEMASESADRVGKVLDETKYANRMTAIADQTVVRNEKNSAYEVAQKIAAERLKGIADKSLRGKDALLNEVRRSNIKLDYDNVMSLYNKNPYKSDYPSIASKANDSTNKTPTVKVLSKEERAMAAIDIKPDGTPLPKAANASGNVPTVKDEKPSQKPPKEGAKIVTPSQSPMVNWWRRTSFKDEPYKAPAKPAGNPTALKSQSPLVNMFLKPKVAAVVDKTLKQNPDTPLTKRLFAVINQVEAGGSDNPNLVHRNRDGSVANAKGAFGVQVKNFRGGASNANAHTLQGQANKNVELTKSFVKTLRNDYHAPASEENILLALRHGGRGAGELLKAERENKPFSSLPKDVQEHVLNQSGGSRDYRAYLKKTRVTFKAQLNAAAKAGY